MSSLLAVPDGEGSHVCVTEHPEPTGQEGVVGVSVGTLVLVGTGFLHPFLWGPCLLPRRALKVTSVLYSQLECPPPTWRPTAQETHLCSRCPGVSCCELCVCLSVPIPPHWFSSTWTYYAPTVCQVPCCTLWDAGVEEVAGVCPEFGTIQKLEFMECERRCLSGRAGHT